MIKRLSITLLILSIIGLLFLGLLANNAAAQTTKTVRITWQDTTVSATFNVWRWNTGQNGFVKLNSTPIAAMTYDDTTAVLGTAYSYKVSAVSAAGESAQSAEADITVSLPIVVPAIPTNLKVTVVITN
jgi:hypothetical protein